MKLVYWFNPNGHWNVISKEVYDTLSKWYGPDHLTFSEEEE